jgi:hypothetical protein
MFNYGKRCTFRGYINFHGYCGKTMTPTTEPTVAQTWVQLVQEIGVVTIFTELNPSWSDAVCCLASTSSVLERLTVRD